MKSITVLIVFVKHQGKRHEVELDPNSTGEIFKFQLYSLTGVEPERQKILIKGGQLKDDTDMSTLKAKAGQTFMMMGTPAIGDGADVVQRPKEVVKFVEDMTEAEAAKADGALPAGLQNLGNTCYLNSTLQTLRSVPELQEELAKYTPSTTDGGASNTPDFSEFGLGQIGGGTDLTASLRDLYKQMSETQEGFPPIMFLHALRTAFPQFNQRAKSGNGYAQQDAEEAWSQIISLLRQKLKIKGQATDDANSSGQASTETSFIDKYLAGRFETTLTCDDKTATEAGEQEIKTTETFLKLDCHINKDTNHLRDGILAALSEKIEKRSTILDHDTTYTKTSRISRLPKYLTVHFVRFFWKREAQKKAKIMRKVTFPLELDVVEFCTDPLKAQLIPVRDKVRVLRKDEEDETRARKRQKMAHKQEEEDRLAGVAAQASSSTATTTAEKPSGMASSKKDAKPSNDEPKDETPYKTDAEYATARTAALLAAKKELFALISPQLAADAGANKSGIYELRGVVTHQGASADSGHYTAYVKKRGKVLEGKSGERGEEDGKWWWFNDEKVGEVEGERVGGLAGGGEFFSVFSFFSFLFFSSLPFLFFLFLGERRWREGLELMTDGLLG